MSNKSTAAHPATEPDSPLSHGGLVALGERHYELMRIRLLAGGLHFLFCGHHFRHRCARTQQLRSGRSQGIGDIRVDAPGEEHRLLRDDGDVPMDPARIQVLDILAIDQNASFSHVIEALQQAEDRRLARARSTCDCHNKLNIESQEERKISNTILLTD